MNETTKPFIDAVAHKLIAQLQQGTAPWQKPWQPGEPGAFLPTNPTTGKRYKGINALHLLCQGHADQRWMTYKQASNIGAQVRKGEKGTPIQYWKFSEERARTDADDRPVLDADGRPVKRTVKLERPALFFATVFNAEQIDGLPPVEAVGAQAWSAVERAETMLRASGAAIRHGERDRAFYQAGTDSIHLPARSQFATADNYYAVALHELGHWTGHASRLGRDLAHPFGSEGYAKEELRAEIASMLLGDELGIGHDPGQHAAYVGSWIKALREDPLEIFRAAADAEKIHAFVLGLEQQQTPERHMSQQDAPDHARERDGAVEEAQARTPGMVINGQAMPGAAVPSHAPWTPAGGRLQSPAMTPREEFSAALRHLRCVVSGEHPIMDGEPHRISVEGERYKEHSGAGFYVAHLDGHPAGYIKNNKTGAETTWKAKGYVLDPEQKALLYAQAAIKRQARERERARLHEEAAARVGRQMMSLLPVVAPTPYLLAKGIEPTPDIFTDRGGRTTYVPARDVDGKQWSMQYIADDGGKRFAKDSLKTGCFHVVGGMDALARAPALVIGEGFATASSLASSIGFAAVAAFDSGNLPVVARALHQRFPDKPVIIAGDDDSRLLATLGVNPGAAKAREAATATGGTLLLPIFAPGEQAAQGKGLTDFNDLATKSVLGKQGLDRQVRSVVDAVIQEKQKRQQRHENLQLGFHSHSFAKIR